MHPDRGFADYVLCGIREGFRVGFDRKQPLSPARRNMPSKDGILRLCIYGILHPEYYAYAHMAYCTQKLSRPIWGRNEVLVEF